MSVDQFVFLDKSRLPTTDVWQGALDGLGIDVHLDESIETASHSGFWPAHCGTSQLGFEYYAGPVAEIFGGEPPVGIGVRDYVVNFVTHSDLQELRCAMLAAAALAIETDGVVFDDETGGLTTGSSLLEQASTDRSSDVGTDRQISRSNDVDGHSTIERRAPERISRLCRGQELRVAGGAGRHSEPSAHGLSGLTGAPRSIERT